MKEEGVRVWDEYKQENFDVRALLFVTINDWPALSNLSRQLNKGYHLAIYPDSRIRDTKHALIV